MKFEEFKEATGGLTWKQFYDIIDGKPVVTRVLFASYMWFVAWVITIPVVFLIALLDSLIEKVSHL